MPASRTKPCGAAIIVDTGHRHPDSPNVCGYPRMHGKRSCVWHWLLKQPAAVQTSYASARREDQLGHDFAVFQAKVPKEKWPPGERWCSGCQSFVPLFYASGSRCKACASTANHQSMVARTYGLKPGEYDALFAMQGGRCYICQRHSPSRRLAVDHDHVSGEVRGLLCPDPERGCNHKVVGPLEANSVDGGLAAAERMVEYLKDPPYARLQRRLQTGLTTEAIVRTEKLARRPRSPYEPSGQVSGQEPPF